MQAWSKVASAWENGSSWNVSILSEKTKAVHTQTEKRDKSSNKNSFFHFNFGLAKQNYSHSVVWVFTTNSRRLKNWNISLDNCYNFIFLGLILTMWRQVQLPHHPLLGIYLWADEVGRSISSGCLFRWSLWSHLWHSVGRYNNFHIISFILVVKPRTFRKANLVT